MFEEIALLKRFALTINPVPGKSRTTNHMTIATHVVVRRQKSINTNGDRFTKEVRDDEIKMPPESMEYHPLMEARTI
jgi:hypothetical protein